MIVTNYTPSQEQEYLDVCISLFYESMHKTRPLNAEIGRAKIRQLYGSGDGILLSAMHEGKIVGVLMANVQDHWFTNDLSAQDYIFYVLPEYRGTEAAKLLVKKYTEQAINKGVAPEFIFIAAFTGVEKERTFRFLERERFEQIGGFFRYKG